MKKTIDATRSCGHGPITPEEEDAYNKIVQWALMFLKRFYVHITNETGEIRFRDENGLLQQREMGTSSKSDVPGIYRLHYFDPFSVGGTQAKLG